MIANFLRLSRAVRGLVLGTICLLAGGGCVRQIATNSLADALAGSGNTFASDNDPRLIRQAAPFSLKLMESVLADTPNHRELLTATSRSFTEYSYAFLVQDADEIEPRDVAAAQALRDEARKLLIRARDYGLRGLDVAHPGISQQLATDPRQALAVTGKRDVPLLYWTAAAWGEAISISKNDPSLVSDQTIFEALIDRALELDESYDYGAIHALLISYEPSRQGASTPADARVAAHFRRAIELSGGMLAGPYVSMAETEAIQKQNKAEFESLLTKALDINVDARPQWRLQNLIAQHRARWLLSRSAELFLE